MNLKKRIPSWGMILPVYAVIACMVFGWTIVSFIWKCSSWTHFFILSEILVLFAYSMTFALLESLILLGIVVLISLLLPASWMRDAFVTRGTTLVVFGFGFVMLEVYRFMASRFEVVHDLPLWSAVGLLVTIVMTVLSTRARVITRAAAWVSDRLIVFLFLLGPIALISFLVVAYRNIF